MDFNVNGFATIRLCSPDVAKSRDWYKQLFAQDPIEDFKDFVSFNICGISLDISVADSKSPLSQGGSVGYWLVDDVEQVIIKASELGGSVYRGPLKVEETKRYIVQIKDPLGNVVGFESPF